MIERNQRKSNQNYQCVTQRQHFNYLRNNSCGIWGTFNSGNPQADIQGQYQTENQNNKQQFKQYNRSNQDQTVKQRKGVSFDNANTSFERKSPQKGQSTKKNAAQQHKPRNNSNFTKKSRIQKDEVGDKLKSEENRQKVQNYIDQLKPFSRTLTNSKFQQLYGKAAPECYGRANTNQPIGGIIYGNHLKTFNVNPHTYTNNPQYYQTHTTALNFGKRTKVCPEQRWKKLEKQLSKKLGLKDKNQAIKEGKQVIYVDVDDSNMNEVLKQNHEFAKAHKDQIRDCQNQYKKEVELAKADNINEFYAKKQAKIAEDLNQSTIPATSDQGEDYQARLNQQFIYRHHDKNGNVRYGADRHALTCFVDLNFPQNDAVYTEELKNRMPIYPKRVQGLDNDIEGIRIANCKKGKQEVYPSHYLLRNCEEPQVLKMFSEKSGAQVSGKRVSQNGVKVNQHGGKTRNNSAAAKNKSFISTNQTRREQNTGGYNFTESDPRNNEMVKSQIMNEAWKNPNIASNMYQNDKERRNTCCQPEHLPHNQRNPQCYKNASGLTGKIPYAG